MDKRVVLPKPETIRENETMLTPAQQGWNSCIEEFERLNQKEGSV